MWYVIPHVESPAGMYWYEVHMLNKSSLLSAWENRKQERRKKKKLFSEGVLLLNYGHYAFEEVLKSRGVACYTATGSVSCSLFCPPSQNLKIWGRFYFPLSVFCPALRIGPWDVLVKGILCQQTDWLLGTCLFWVTPQGVCSPFPLSSPAPCLWTKLAGFIYSPTCTFVRVGWREILVQYKVCLCPHL